MGFEFSVLRATAARSAIQPKVCVVQVDLDPDWTE